LGKDADGMDRTDVGNDVAIDVFVLQEKGAEIRLATLHHLFYGCYDMRVSDDDGFVESREERATCDRKGEDLRVDLWDRLFSY
jgi:hypothetical protein